MAYVSRGFVGRVTSPLVTTLLKLGLIGPVKAEIKRLAFVKWSLYWNVTWLFGRVLLILSHCPATFGIHRLYGSGDDGVFNISSNFNRRFKNGQYMRKTSFIKTVYSNSITILFCYNLTMILLTVILWC